MEAARDWEMRADLGRPRLAIPTSIAVTAQRPDIIIFSHKTRKTGMIELTVPKEERIQLSSELKKLKYADLQDECRRKGYEPRLWTVEVGSKGFMAASMMNILKDFGITGRRRKRTLKQISEAATEASQVLWWKANSLAWGENSL